MVSKLYRYTILLLTTITFSCGDNGMNCEVIANASSPNFLKVVNQSSSKISVDFGTLPFGATMQVNKCELTGLPTGSHYVEISKCEGQAPNCNSVGNLVREDFTLAEGDTHTITVTDSFF